MGQGHIRELEAFASNVGLSDGGIISLARRERVFSDLTEARYIRILLALADNPRLKEPYGDHRPMDGWAEHMHNKVFDEIWGLALTLPADQTWATVLERLLRNCLPSLSFPSETAINRWRIDPPKTGAEKYYWPGASFFLRSRIADTISPDDLKDADDFSLRLSFYRRVDPLRYPEWPDLVSRDFKSGNCDEAAFAALENKQLWHTAAQRDRLHELCWSVPDPNSDLQLPNAYRETRQRMEKEFPDWFADDNPPEAAPSPEPEIRELLSDLLTKIDQLIGLVTPQPRPGRFPFG